MRHILSYFIFIALIGILMQNSNVNAISTTDINNYVKNYNGYVKSYNLTSTGKTNALKNLKKYLSGIPLKTKNELKKNGIIFQTIPKKGLFSEVSLKPEVTVVSNTKKDTNQNAKFAGKIIIESETNTSVTEGNNYIIYSAKISTSGGDIKIDGLNIVQTKNGNGMNITELYKNGYDFDHFYVSTNMNTPKSKYAYNDKIGGISFDSLDIVVKQGEILEVNLVMNTERVDKLKQNITNPFKVSFVSNNEIIYKSAQNITNTFTIKECDDTIKIDEKSEIVPYYSINSNNTGIDIIQFKNWLSANGISYAPNGFTNQGLWPLLGYKSKRTNQFKPVGISCSEISTAKSNVDDLFDYYFDKYTLYVLLKRVEENDALLDTYKSKINQLEGNIADTQNNYSNSLNNLQIRYNSELSNISKGIENAKACAQGDYRACGK